MIDLSKIDFSRLTLPEWADWVPVPWQDVEWLVEHGSVVRLNRYDADIRETIRRVGVDPDHTYRADRRTFPAGYDPEKPRWVEIGFEQVERLQQTGADIACLTLNGHWLSRKHMGYYGGSPFVGAHYAVDIHTLPPGVPLHVDQPKPEPRPCTRGFALANRAKCQMRWREDDGSWSQWYPIGGLGSHEYEFRTTAMEEAKVWRNCSRDFALAHPVESEWRVRQRDGHRLSWSTWRPMSRVPLFQASVNDYEFRTTAREHTAIPDLEVIASDPPPLVVGLGVQLREGVAVVGGDHVCIDDHGRVKFAQDGTPIGDLVIRL